MKIYFRRVAKYCIRIIIMFIIIYIAFDLLGYNNQITLQDFAQNKRSILLFVALIIFALTYPLFGFVTRTLMFNATENVGAIEKVLAMNGYLCVDNNPSKQVYKADNKYKKLILLYEDDIIITTTDGISTIKGPRKEVVKASFRFNTFINK